MHPNQATAVATGDIAPDFSLTNTDGELYSLPAGLARGPLVLVFYRGDW